MLISEAYRQLNRELHDVATYGRSGHKWATLLRGFETRDILDYGCGKCSLEEALGFDIQNYDPAISGMDGRPRPAKLVFCGDVLEHVEPDCLADVLQDLHDLTLETCVLVIATRPANKRLPDGRNAHLIVQDAEWWADKVGEYFIIDKTVATSREVVFTCTGRQRKTEGA